MPMYICPICKEQNEEHLKYCKECGNWLLNTKFPSLKIKKETSNRSKWLKRIGIVILGIFIIRFVTLLVYASDNKFVLGTILSLFGFFGLVIAVLLTIIIALFKKREQFRKSILILHTVSIILFFSGSYFLGAFGNTKAWNDTFTLDNFANKSQIIGHWELVQWPDEAKKKMNKVDPWPSKYQWFAIYENGTMFSMMSTHPEQVNSKKLDELSRMMPSTVSYTLKNDTFLVRHSDIKNYEEVWRVNVITKRIEKNGVEFLPEDILMSLYRGKSMPVYYRHLRKITK